MQEKLWGNEYRTTLVCVDSYRGQVLEGRLYNPCPNGNQRFGSLMEFFQVMERLLDQMRFPQNFSAVRSFRTPQETENAPKPNGVQTERSGSLATFAVRVMFRQNASWQGSVTWLEKRQEESFRSALELCLLMDSALRTHEGTTA